MKKVQEKFGRLLNLRYICIVNYLREHWKKLNILRGVAVVASKAHTV